MNSLEQENNFLKLMIKGYREEIEEIEQERDYFENHWNELKKWIIDLGTEKTNEFGDNGKTVAIWNYVLLDKMHELEKRERL